MWGRVFGVFGRVAEPGSLRLVIWRFPKIGVLLWGSL